MTKPQKIEGGWEKQIRALGKMYSEHTDKKPNKPWSLKRPKTTFCKIWQVDETDKLIKIISDLLASERQKNNVIVCPLCDVGTFTQGDFKQHLLRHISKTQESERQRCVEIIGEDETPNLENLLVIHDSTDSDKCFENQARNELRKEIRNKLNTL